MTELMTMKQCFDACSDDDIPFINHLYNANPTTQKTKSRILSDCDNITYAAAISGQWQIKRAEPKVLSAQESWDSLKNSVLEKMVCGADAYKVGFEDGDENGQLREWNRILTLLLGFDNTFKHHNS